MTSDFACSGSQSGSCDRNLGVGLLFVWYASLSRFNNWRLVNLASKSFFHSFFMLVNSAAKFT